LLKMLRVLKMMPKISRNENVSDAYSAPAIARLHFFDWRGRFPELLEILARIVDGEDDFELVQVYILASVFDDRTPRQTTEFLCKCGICLTDIIRALKTVYDRVQGLPVVHGWN